MGFETLVASIISGSAVACITFLLGRRETRSSIIGNQSTTIANQADRIVALEADNRRLRDKVIMLERRVGEVLLELEKLRGKAS